MKVRHKPTIVDAVPWNGTQHALNELRALGLRDYRVEPAGTKGGPDVLIIRTLEDERDGRVALIGDWVVKGTRGEFYPVKADVFTASYEPHTGTLL